VSEDVKRIALHRQIRVLSFLPALAVTVATFAAGWGAMRLLAPGRGLPTMDRQGAGFVAVIVATYFVHEVLHVVVLRACRVPWAALRLKLRWWALLIEVSPPPPPRVMRAVALAPAIVLSAALAVLIARTGSSLWLLLFSMHAGGCTWDLVLARRLGRSATSAGADDPEVRRRARRGVLAIGLLSVAAIALAGAAPARWIATRVVLRPAPIEAGGPAQAPGKHYLYTPGPAGRLRATWRCYRSGELVLERQAERELPAGDGEIVVRFADGASAGTLEGSIDLGDGHVASMVLELTPELLKVRLSSADEGLHRLKPGSRHSLLTVFGGGPALAAAGDDAEKLSTALRSQTFDEYEYFVQAQVEFLR